MPTTSKKEPAQHTSLSSPIRYYPSALPDLNPFFPSHWHNEFELNFIRSGTAVFFCNGIQYTPEEGDIFIFQPNQTHGMSALENKKIYYDTLLFSSKVFGSFSERGNHLVISPLVSGEAFVQLPISRNSAGYDVIHKVVESVFDASKSDDALSDLLAKSELQRLFYYLHIYGHIVYRQNNGSADEVRIRPVLAYIDQHYAEDLSLDTLAQLIPLSKSYLMFYFKRITGTSIVTYITQIRIRNACELLLSTSKQVVQIAMECGFDNLSNFNRQFKKHTGCSPSVYRKTYSSNAKSSAEA